MAFFASVLIFMAFVFFAFVFVFMASVFFMALRIAWGATSTPAGLRQPETQAFAHP